MFFFHNFFILFSSVFVWFFLILLSFTEFMIFSDNLGHVTTAASCGRRVTHLLYDLICLIGFKGVSFRVFNTCSIFVIHIFHSIVLMCFSFLFLLVGSKLSVCTGASLCSFLCSIVGWDPFLSFKNTNTWVELNSPYFGM